MSQETESKWARYYDSIGGAQPHWTLLTALMNFEREGAAPGTAVDLGCGQGRDVGELLERGWSVIAVDSEKSALERLVSATAESLRDKLETVECEMEAYQIPSVRLINASLSLPFCRRERFNALWRQVLIKLAPGGRFAGHFFGERDDWAHTGRLIHYTKPQLKNVLYGLEVELFSEVESDFPTATGEIKHWHIFQVVARKPGKP